VPTDPAELSYYAARSLLSMFAALALSIVFTFVYAAPAARLRRAEKVLLLLDILQSVPILGFLPDHRAVLVARLCRRWAGQSRWRCASSDKDAGRISGCR
jgi:ABC-type anion transport system duplicated permease subunit